MFLTMTTPHTIAIDGPAASGKSTLGKLLADHFGYIYFDTGVLYRALTYVALEQAVDLANAAALAKLAQTSNFEILAPSVADGRQYTVLANGNDITWPLRAANVERNVSQVAAHPAVREALRDTQRQIGKAGHVVMAGRDIGAVIMPDAQLKIYLDASVEERAQRRAQELNARGRAISYSEVLADLTRRDAIDAANTFLAADAITITTDGRSPEDVFQAIVNLMGVEAQA